MHEWYSATLRRWTPYKNLKMNLKAKRFQKTWTKREQPKDAEYEISSLIQLVTTASLNVS